MGRHDPQGFPEVNEAEGLTAGFIAIVLDEKVIGAPRSANEITGGGTQISGSMDVQEARDLSNILTAGKLDAQVQVTSSDFVGPTLGKRSMRAWSDVSCHWNGRDRGLHASLLRRFWCNRPSSAYSQPFLYHLCLAGFGLP